MPTTVRSWIAPRMVGWREAVVLLAIAWLVPFLVHVIPWSGRLVLGAHLLPMFWTTFIAVYFYGAGLGLAVGLVTPAASALLTGLPLPPDLGLMAVEAGLFVLIAAAVLARWPACRVAAPLAYVAGKSLVIALQWVAPAIGDGRDPVGHLLSNVENGWPGLAVLLAINAGLVALYPKTDAWERE